MQLSNIVKLYAGEMILNNINVEIKANDRIAIVGRNGVGKSTLLKIMTNEISYDAGNIYQVKDLQIGYLEQHMNVNSTRTIWDEMMSVFTYLINEEKEIAQLAKKIELNAGKGIVDDKLLHEYGRRQEKFEQNGGYRYESDIRGVLIGLGFNEASFNSKVHHLSGGQKTRLALGKLLLRKPDILFLDEPTNHLDIDTLVWLEQYLVNYPGAIVIVSHDRYFLDKIVSIVYEIANKTSKKYFGTYTDYLVERKKNYEQQLRRYEKQQEEIKRAEQFIERNIARASTSKRAQSRRKQLEKMDIIERPFGGLSSTKLSFQVNRTSGNDVLRIKDLSFNYSNKKPLLNDISFSIQRGERMALIGENGIGKTTLLNLIKSGHDDISLGANVQVGYYDQEQQNLNPSKTVLKELWDDFPNMIEQDIRSVLGSFLFSGDDVLKHVDSLSGGEKARLSLAKLMLQKANFLILDEPTNHLDLDSKEVLEDALIDFPGTILFVSHDRYFINKIADTILELTVDGTTTYLGDFDYYIEKKNEQQEIERIENRNITNQSTTKSSLSFEEQKRIQSEQRKKERKIATIESQIEQNEEQISNIELKMTEPEILQDHEKLLELSQEVEQLKKETEQLMEQWTTLQM